MPTRSYYFPRDFRHLEQILHFETDDFSEKALNYYRDKDIPPLQSTGTLPLFLGISPKTVFSIRRHPNKHYRSFRLKKKDGTTRRIYTPRTYLKVIQWWILDNILNNTKIASNVFGFVLGRSAIQNADYHLGAVHILNVDIKQFFPSITIEQVQEIFSDIGYCDDVSNMLAELCCLNGCVPQGAPTSPALANLVLKDLDAELSELAAGSRCKYSRYADDLTFSSMSFIDKGLLRDIEDAVGRAGFVLKPAKTRFAGRGDRMEVTGVVINEKLQPNRVWRKNTRARLHQLEMAGRVTRRELDYLYGIRGMAAQFPESPQMRVLAQSAERILELKSHTVIGYGATPVLPEGLTFRQAQVLSLLAPRKTNFEIALDLGTTEAAVKKRLQEAFRKIGVSDRRQAELWARENL